MDHVKNLRLLTPALPKAHGVGIKAHLSKVKSIYSFSVIYPGIISQESELYVNGKKHVASLFLIKIQIKSLTYYPWLIVRLEMMNQANLIRL